MCSIHLNMHSNHAKDMQKIHASSCRMRVHLQSLCVPPTYSLDIKTKIGPRYNTSQSHMLPPNPPPDIVYKYNMTLSKIFFPFFYL